MQATFILLSLLLLMVITPGLVTAQHDHGEKDEIAIPSSLKSEHDQIHEELSALLKLGGKTGAAAKAVANALHEHFEAEEEYAMPPLAALQLLAMNAPVPHLDQIVMMSEKLERSLPEMLAEHKAIVKKIEELRVAARTENQPSALAFADKLELHALNEEQILYPSSILVGKYIKLTTTAR